MSWSEVFRWVSLAAVVAFGFWNKHLNRKAYERDIREADPLRFP
jgi:hypothetical protein